MSETIHFKCKTCGALLDALVAQSQNGLVECPYCFNVWTIPKKETSPAALSFLRMGEHDLDTCKFDDAFSAYKKAAELDSSEPEAYFGMALAEFKVQYLKDEASDPPRLQPICHEISRKSFSENKNFLRALSLATAAQKAEYERRGKEIEEIKEEFSRLKESGLDYDCFLCVKVSDENGGTTQDSHEALRLYHYLKDRGYAPFYSEEEIKDRSGSDYEALILYALYTSECMLIVCSNEEYLNTKWVKNEYTRFSKMIATEDKERDAITFVFHGTPIERLPGLDKKIQGIDLGKPDAYSRIEEYITSFRPISIGEAPQIRRKEYTGRSYKKKEVQRHGVQKRELMAGAVGEITVSDRAKLKIANDFLTRRDYDNALRFVDNMLRENEANGEAYWLRFLAGLSCSNEEDFINREAVLIGFSDFEKAISYAQDPGRRKQFYDVLHKRVLRQKDLCSYKEFIELPDSNEEWIAELTDAMYEVALRNGDETVFNEIIKTVTDTDKYVSMNLGFAHVIEQKNPSGALPYYNNILSADEGHDEALWKTFVAEHEGKQALFSYCSGEGISVLEEKLFSFGYNRYANDQLFELCLQNAEKRTEEACKLFDFVLTMLPKQKNKIFIEYLNRFIEELFLRNRVRFAAKYNELLLNENKLNHEAYFNRVMIKHGYRNALELIKIAGHLMEDEDYFSALNLYAEQFPNKETNLYLDINDVISDLAKKVKNDECREYLYKNVYVHAAELQKCENKLLLALKEEAMNLVQAVCRDHHCSNIDSLYQLRVDITSDPRLHRARVFAETSGYKNLMEEIDGLLTKQGECVAKNVAYDRTKERKQKKNAKVRKIAYITVIIFAILCALTVPLVTILNFAGVPSAILYLISLFSRENSLGRTLLLLFMMGLFLFFILILLLAVLGAAKAGKKKTSSNASVSASTSRTSAETAGNITFNPAQMRAFAVVLSIIMIGAACIYHGITINKWNNIPHDLAMASNGYMVRITETYDGWRVDGLIGETDKVVIPDRYKDKYVVEIADKAFETSTVSEIELPAHLQKIGARAFYYCRKLTSVAIPASVTTIGTEAFRSSALQRVWIPDSVSTIGSYAFYISGTIFCEAESRPSEWASDWNGSGLYMGKVSWGQIA